MSDWTYILFGILAAADLFLIPAALREYGRSKGAALDGADAERRAHRRRSINMAMWALQVLFVLLLGVILLAGLPRAWGLAVFALCVVVLAAQYRLSVLRDR